jgi:hypothetical protein
LLVVTGREEMVGWQLWLTAVPLPLILYAACAAIWWPILIKHRVESELERIIKGDCADLPLKVFLPLYQILYSIIFVALLLAVYGIPSIFFGPRGAFISAAVAIAILILVNLPWYVKNARSGLLLAALLIQMLQVLGVLAMTLLWLYSPITFALVVAADNALQALVAWRLAHARVAARSAARAR